MLKATATFFVASALLLSGCSVLQKSSLQDIPEGKYIIRSNDSLQKKQQAENIFVFHENDSIFFRSIVNNNNAVVKGLIYPLASTTNELKLLRPSFDFDIFTTPFKFRPALDDIPQQLNTNFNGSLYFGYRIDIYKVKQKQPYSGILREQFNKNGIGIGAFAGVSSVFINPKFMRNTIDYEYDAMAIDYGIAALFGVRNFSTGLSVGFDFLTDKNRKHWVYQNKPWVGIFIGLNLN